MVRIFTASAIAIVALLLLSSDADACRRRRACCVVTYTTCGTGNVIYAPNAVPAPANVPAAGAANGNGRDVGRPGYNPGGLGGPRSGLGVRPGPGLGGAGPRR